MRKTNVFLIFLITTVLLSGCAEKNEPKEWTYELLEEEFGGIIELDFESTKKSLDLIENNKYAICAYIIQKKEVHMYKDLYYITVTDNVENSYSGNTIDVCITQNAFNKVSEGEYIYAIGNSGANNDLSSFSLSCHTNGYISHNEIENALTISEYIKLMEEISKNTYFQVQGVIIQDGENYMLYESKEAYKENKFGYIRLDFTEEQHNLNGKTVTVIGKTDTFLHMGLIDCSIVE